MPRYEENPYKDNPHLADQYRTGALETHAAIYLRDVPDADTEFAQVVTDGCRNSRYNYPPEGHGYPSEEG